MAKEKYRTTKHFRFHFFNRTASWTHALHQARQACGECLFISGPTWGTGRARSNSRSSDTSTAPDPDGDPDPEAPAKTQTAALGQSVGLSVGRKPKPCQADAKKIKTLAFSIDLLPDFLFSLLCLHNELPPSGPLGPLDPIGIPSPDHFQLRHQLCGCQSHITLLNAIRRHSRSEAISVSPLVVPRYITLANAICCYLYSNRSQCRRQCCAELPLGFQMVELNANFV